MNFQLPDDYFTLFMAIIMFKAMKIYIFMVIKILNKNHGHEAIQKFHDHEIKITKFSWGLPMIFHSFFIVLFMAFSWTIYSSSGRLLADYWPISREYLNTELTKECTLNF